MANLYVSSLATGGGDGSLGDPWTFAEMLSATPAAGDVIHILADGTYSRSATGTVAFANGTAAANIVLTGANSSGTVDGTRPTIQASGGSITLLNVTSSHIRLDYLIVDGNSQTSTSGIVLGANYTRVRRSKVQGTTVRGIHLNAVNSLLADRCELTGCSGTAAIDLGSNTLARFCESHGNTTHGFLVGVSALTEFCLSYGNTGGSTHGFSLPSVGYRATCCTAYANGGDGFNLDSNSGFGTYLANCLAYGNGAEGFGSDGVKAGAFLQHCAGGNNTGGNFNATNLPNAEDFVALTADPFTDASGSDFSLNDTAGGGAACRAAGFPGVFPRGLTTGFLDIGAVQHQDAGGGGGGGGFRVIAGAPLANY